MDEKSGRVGKVSAGAVAVQFYIERQALVGDYNSKQ